MPPAIQNIIEFNRLFAESIAANLSWPIAFLAGTLSVLSPCILPILPAFFANTFKDKRAITKMTFIFFLGFAAIFIAFGIIAGWLGKSLFDLPYRGLITFIIGLCLIALGAATILGLHLPALLNRKASGVGGSSIFLTGIFFAFGWTACLGPILAGVLTMGSMLGNWWQAGILLLFYSFGIFAPIFLLAIFFDRTKWLRHGWFHREVARLKIGQRLYSVLPANLIAGLLFMAIGATFAVIRNTNFVNRFSMFGGKQLFYSWQRNLQGGGLLFATIGTIVFIFIVGLIIWSWRHDKKRLP